MLHQAVAVLRVLPKSLEGREQIVVQHQRAALRQVVKYGGGLLEKQGQVILNARRGNALAHVFVDAAFARVALYQLAPAAAKLAAGGFVHRELAPWQQAHLIYGVQAALAVGVKGADGVDFIIKQVHPVGLLCAHGVQINQAAAHGIFTWAYHLADMAVARKRKLRLECCLIKLLPRFEMEGVSRQKRGRSQLVKRRGGWNNHHIGTIVPAVLADAPQGCQTLANQVLVGRKAVVRQRFPVRKKRTTQAGGEKRQFFKQAPCVSRISRNYGRATPCCLIAHGNVGQE